MGAYPEHPKSPGDEPERSDSVTWIPRDRFSHGQPVEPPAPSSGMMDTLRRNPRPWIIGIVVLVLLAIAVSIARNAMAPKGADAAANQAAQVPLVSVVTPRVKAVTATVTFTGTIHARYDMPISAEGESGRITAVLVEAGDTVKRGQVLARLDQSVLRPQINRLVRFARGSAGAGRSVGRRVSARAGRGGRGCAVGRRDRTPERAASVTDEARVKVAAAQLAEAEARLGQDGDARAGRTASCSRAPPKWARRRAPAASRCSASRAMAKWRCAARSPSATRGALGGSDRARLPHRASPSRSTARCACSVPSSIRRSRLGEIRIVAAAEPGHCAPAHSRAAKSSSAMRSARCCRRPPCSRMPKALTCCVVNGDSKAERRAVRVANTVPEGLVISEGLKGDERVVSTAGAFLRAGER